MDESQTECKKLIDAAYDGDLKTIRDIVASGFDLSTPNSCGESILSAAIFELSFWNEVKPYRYEVIKLLLELGANPNQLNDEKSGSLTDAMLMRDTEMIRILLEAGAKPNEFGGFSESESFYDYAEFDYRFCIWDLHLPEKKPENISDDENTWLLWLDEMAVKYQRRRPDYLFLLRQYGAKTLAELHNENLGK
jgi:hypothetical protein